MISVAVATYNGIKFIEEQLNSICNQTVIPDEIIIQDDLSNDGTYEFVIKYAQKHKNINWKVMQNKENLGYKKNFYEALCKTNGDYIFLCDQDDIWFKDKIENMINVMKNNSKILLLCSNLKSFYIEKCKNKINEEKFGFKKIINFKFGAHCINTPRPGCSFCVKRELLDEYIEKINFDIPHDNYLWQLACLKGQAYLYNRNTMNYRRHANNASNNKKNSINKRLNAINIQINEINNMIKLVKDENKIISFLKKQKYVFEMRYNCVKTRDIICNIKLIKYNKYYYNMRLWLSDMYYILRYRG